MIVFNGLGLIGLAIMVGSLCICGVVLVIDRIVYTIKKRQQKRIDKALGEVDE